MAVTRGTQFFHLQDGCPCPTGPHVWARAAGDGRAPLAEGLPGVGRAPQTWSRAELADSKPGLSSGPGSVPARCLAFLLPFRVTPGPACSLARGRPPEVAQTLCYLSPGGPVWRAQSAGQDAVRYVRAGTWAPGRGRGCPGTSPPLVGGDRAETHLQAWTRLQESCRLLPHLRTRRGEASRLESHSVPPVSGPPPPLGVPKIALG